MEDTSVAHISNMSHVWRDVLPHTHTRTRTHTHTHLKYVTFLKICAAILQRIFFSASLCATFLFKIRQRGSHTLTHSHTHTHSFFRNSCVSFWQRALPC